MTRAILKKIISTFASKKSYCIKSILILPLVKVMKMSQTGEGISVLIPTYNRANLLVRAVESVLEQTYPHWKIIVVDDGSTDNTAEIVGSLQKQHLLGEDRFLYVYQKNAGYSAALNTGIGHVQSAWTAFLDSDDTWLPTKLDSQMEALREFGDTCGACFTDARYLYNPDRMKTVFEMVHRTSRLSAEISADTIDRVIEERWGIPIQSILMKTELFKKAGLFDEQLRLAQDRDFIYRLALATQLCFVNKVLVEIDRTPVRTVGMIELLNNTPFSLEQHLHMYNEWMKSCPAEDGERRQKIRHAIQALHSQSTNEFLAVGDYVRALQQAKQAWKVSPNYRHLAKWAIVWMAPGIVRKLCGSAPFTIDN